jgi:nickel-dependent lactate racemase
MTGVRMTYGAGWLECEAPGQVRVLRPTYPADPRSEADLVDEALERPLGTPPLEDLARGRRRAVVLIACRTRRTGSHIFLPRIVRALNAAGLSDDRILVYAATGTHDNWRPEDATLLSGSDCARRLRFQGHDCRSNLDVVGTTSRGNRVALSRTYLDADLKIATGRVTYHYFAGFTGGRKAVLPGVAGFDTIVFNHRMATTREPAVRLDPGTRNGSLEGNPIHEDMLEAALLAPPDFTLSTVLDADNHLVRAFGGDMQASHAAAVAEVRDGDAPVLERPADWMFLSCGGPHCDVNAVQALKAVVNNHRAVRGGGAIVFTAECAEGMAPWLRELGAIRDRAELERRILRGELRHPHNALYLGEATGRAHVVMVTSLPRADVEGLGFRHAHDLAEACHLATELAGPPTTTVVVPFGNTTVVRVAGRIQ